MDPLEGYDVFKQQLASGQAAGRGSVAPPLSWWAGIAQRFQGWGMSPAVALLIALVGAQLMVSLTGLAGRDGGAATGSSMRSARSVARQAEPGIILKPGAPFDAVLALLMENRCSIIWGPSQLGELWLVAEPQGAAGVVAQRLAASPLVENVQMLESVK